MYKKLLTLIAGAVFSMNASAGYVRYDFSDPNSPLSGYFYQRDSDRSIAYFDFRISDNVKVNREYTPYFSERYVASSTIYWNRMAPTNFSIVDVLSDAFADTVTLNFYGPSPSDQGIAAAVHLSRIPMYYGPEYDIPRFADWYFGSVTGRAATPQEEDYLDNTARNLISHVVPTYINVPEPASLALFAVGAFGIASLARRRKSAQ
jgi:hypothetical protein